ncbi:unnamed protein product [Angiostrongylus costaricensis]|uniref:Cytochrome b5 heme-binding domain-containing protein n=1 Tax=Angiostrongylus costaricensis TaxID=334426 RepID=A0A0R3PY19_ANGCS|nr:unnamed protein product [Angiostrongylus costaricensis]
MTLAHVITLEQTSPYRERRSFHNALLIQAYDVTPFLCEHLGGAEAITEFAGKDATASYEDTGHSKDAREVTKEYLISRLITDTASCSLSTTNTTSKGPSSGANWRDIIFSPTWSSYYFNYCASIVIVVFVP